MGLEAPAFTVVDHIPLGRRIAELKKEKGGYYSNVSMAARLGMHHETFRLMLKGKREIYTFELDKISKDLKIPVARILQEDLREEAEQLSVSLINITNIKDSLEIAVKHNEKAIGLSEQYGTLHRLGKANYNANNFREANSILIKAHQLAVEIKELYGDTEALYKVMYHLMESFTAIQDYVTASKLLDEIRPFFVGTPSRHAAICYQLAMFEESQGNVHVARQFAIESLKYALENEKPILIAKTRLNLAHFEFLTLDYNRSRELLELAIDGLKTDHWTRLIARKELIKSLLKIEQKEEAITQLNIALEEAEQLNWTDMWGKLQILSTQATNDPQYAQAILEDTGNKLKIRYLDCKCLKNHFKQHGDGAMFLQYHEVAERMCVQHSDFLDEREL